VVCSGYSASLSHSHSLSKKGDADAVQKSSQRNYRSLPVVCCRSLPVGCCFGESASAKTCHPSMWAEQNYSCRLFEFKTANRDEVVGPPPAAVRRPVYVAPPPVYVPPPAAARPEPARNPTPSQTSTDQNQAQSQPRQAKQQSVWFNAAWITAVAVLVGAFAKLISALRKSSSD